MGYEDDGTTQPSANGVRNRETNCSFAQVWERVGREDDGWAEMSGRSKMSRPEQEGTNEHALCCTREIEEAEVRQLRCMPLRGEEGLRVGSWLGAQRRLAVADGEGDGELRVGENIDEWELMSVKASGERKEVLMSGEGSKSRGRGRERVNEEPEVVRDGPGGAGAGSLRGGRTASNGSHRRYRRLTLIVQGFK